MPYLPGAATPAATVPPEEEYVAPAEATPAPVAATEEEALYGPAPAAQPAAQAAAPATEEDAIYGDAAAAPPVDDARLGPVVDPLMAQAPEPVRNLADIVGQPVGGIIDTAQAVGGELLQGDIPGAAEQALGGFVSGVSRPREQAGARVAEGQPVAIGPEDVPQQGILSPVLDAIGETGIGQAIGNVLTTPLPGTEGIPNPTATGAALLGGDPGAALAGLPSASLSPLGIDEWWASLPPAEQQAIAAGGGNAVVDAFSDSIGAPVAPPGQLVNPLDAGAINAGPIDRALAIGGDVDDFLGGWFQAGREGALGPFLKSQALELAMDPSMLVPPAVGARVTSTVGRTARRIPGVERALTLTPEAQRTIQGEGIQQAGAEIVGARAQLPDPSGAVPAAALAPDPIPPPPGNGRLVASPDPGQAAAAPPIPPPRTVPRDADGLPAVGYDRGRPVFLDELRSRQPPRTAAPDPARPASARAIPPVRATPRQVPAPSSYPGYIKETKPGGPFVLVDYGAGQRIPNTPEFASPRDAQKWIRQQAAAPTKPTTPPPRAALGLRGRNWYSPEGGNVVENPRSPRAAIAPAFRPTIEAAYRDMFDAPTEQFWQPFDADYRQTNVPPAADGLHARYRGAMRQGLFLLDDWPEAKVRDRLPAVVGPDGGIDWARVEALALRTGPEHEIVRTAARKALAGRRAHDLYVHRIRNAADPDAEVHNLLRSYHLDQLSERFDDWKPEDWRNRARALGEVIRLSNYLPTAEVLASWRTLDLAAEARAALPDLPADRLRRSRLAGRPLVEGDALVLSTPSGERLPILAMPGGGVPERLPIALADEAAAGADDAPTPEQVAAAAPQPEPAPPPRPAWDIPPEVAAHRQAANAAVAHAPAPVREAVAAMDDPSFHRYGVAPSEQAARDLDQRAAGLFRFPDGYAGEPGYTVNDVLHHTLRDVEFWADVERISEQAGGWKGGKEARMMRRWETLDKRFNPDGSVDRSLLQGPDRQAARDAFAFDAFRKAEERTRPSNAPKSRIGAINEGYLGFVRTTMLFNYLNIPRYVAQNVATNTVNLGARVGARAVVDLWTSPADAVRVFRANRAIGQDRTFTTRWGSIEAQIGMGSKPNVAMSHVTYLKSRNKPGGKIGKGVDLLSRVLAPETLRYAGNTADQLFREKAAEAVVMREFRTLNRELVPLVMERMGKGNGFGATPLIPDAKARQVVHDFLAENRRLIDANSGDPYRTVAGAAAKVEPVWNPEAFGQYLKRRLREDMRDPPDAATFDRAVDRITRDTKNRVRGILDEAERTVDDAFFSWRDTNADAMARKFFLYHYWSSRQGGLYLEEAAKRPWILSSYGRMMQEFEAQAEEYDQPNWMKGFFQFQNSVAGFSTWYSPFDLLQSLLTFADWQYGEDYAEYKDVTALGKAGGQAPFLIHPLLQLGAYWLGLMGPDYYAPPVTGAETFGAKAIDLLNLANAQGKLPAWVNEAGIGVDENGNKVPLPVRPLQELYARVGNAISTALAPVTGLSPVEVFNTGGSWERNIASIGETETRKANPEWDQMQVNRHVTAILDDPGSPEYQAWFRKAADMPYQLTEGMPLAVSGALRTASPFRVYNWPEQYNLDRWNVASSGYAPERNIPNLGETTGELDENGNPILTPAGERAKFVQSAARYGATATPEARRLANLQNEYYALEPLDYAEANDLAGAIYGMNLAGPVTVGGVEYSPEQVAAMSNGDRYDLGTQALADAGYSRDDQQGIRDAQSRYVADNPELAGYFEYKDLVRDHPGGAEGFVMETAAVNPGFRQFVRSSLMDHVTGEIDYGAAQYVDAYLASQGQRPSVYSPVVGNEPSTIPGGYPALAGVERGQPLLPPVRGAEPFPLYSRPVDPDSYYANEDLIAWIDPALAGQMQTVGGADPRYGMVQVSVGDQVGYVDPAYLASAAPPEPTGAPIQAPPPVQPTGGLAGLAGGVTSALGAVKDALGNAVTSLTGHNSGAPVKPAPGPAPAAYDVVPSADGMGVQSTRDGSDRSWMEAMIGPNRAAVSVDFKQPVTWNVSYDYQNGHGADGSTHAAYDITCDDPNGACAGTPISAPLAGRVVCAGYGQGTGEAMASPACTYSEATTLPGQAHTVVLDVGADAAGNAVQLSFNHMGESAVAPGQTLAVGDAIGTMGDTDAGPHVHLEGWGWCPSQNTYLLLDPQLVVGGYYRENAVC